MYNDLLSTHPILSLPHNARYKKPSRQTIISYKVIPSLIALYEQPFHLSKYSFMLVSILRLYIIKLKILFVDTSELVSSFTKVKEKVRRNLAVTKNPLLLNILCSEFNDEESMMDARDSIIMDYIPDFSMNEIEVRRNDDTTMLSDKNLSLLSKEELIKKRIVDNIIECELSDLRIKKRKNDLFLRENKLENNRSKIFLSKELDDFFKRIKREEIEVARNDTSCEVFEPNLSEPYFSENLMEDSWEVMNEGFEFPDKFVFEEVVEGKDRKIRGMLFSNLLNFCSEGKMKCVQDAPYEQIRCEMVLAI